MDASHADVIVNGATPPAAPPSASGSDPSAAPAPAVATAFPSVGDEVLTVGTLQQSQEHEDRGDDGEQHSD